MRTLSALLMVLLLCSLQQTCSGGIEGSDYGADCCAKLTKVKIPIKRIVSYQLTRSNCAKQAVVFVMTKGNTVCVDSNLDWAQSHMKTVDLRKNPATTA